MENRQKEDNIRGKYTTDGRPNHFSTLTPFIVVDRPEEALAFYEAVFGAKTKSVTDIGNEGHKMIIHAEIDFGYGFLQLGAANPAYGLILPPDEGNVCYSLNIYVPDVDETYSLALAHGAKVREELANFVSGDRYCSILDPFGIRWSIMTRIEDISMEDSYRRVAEWSKTLES